MRSVAAELVELCAARRPRASAGECGDLPFHDQCVDVVAQTSLHVDLQLPAGTSLVTQTSRLRPSVSPSAEIHLPGAQEAVAVLGDVVRLDAVAEVDQRRAHGDRQQQPERHPSPLAWRIVGRWWPHSGRGAVGARRWSACENGAVNVSSLPRALDGHLAGDFNDPTNERIIYLSAAGLVVVGLALLLGTIVWWRRGRQEHPALAPLEVMSARAWEKAPEGDRRRRLDQVRHPVPELPTNRSLPSPSTCRHWCAACRRRSTTSASLASQAEASAESEPDVAVEPEAGRGGRGACGGRGVRWSRRRSSRS